MASFTANVVPNQIWLVPLDGNVTNPALSYIPGRNSGFSRLGSNLNVSINGVQTATLFNNGVECMGNINITGYLLGDGTGFSAPTMTISNILVANSTYAILDDTAVDTAGGYVVMNCRNIPPGSSVLIGSDPASAITYSSTQLQLQVPPKSAGTYPVTATRPDGKQAIVPFGITYSPFPIWSSTSLANVTKTIAFTRTLAATEANGSTLTYSVSNGSSLPGNVSLASNGVLSGNITSDTGNATTYAFTIQAIDTELQEIPRTFSLYAFAAFTLSSVAVTDASYTVLDDTAVDTAGGFIRLVGTGFTSDTTVSVGGTSATVTYISSTQLNVAVPAKATGSYTLLVTRPGDGSSLTSSLAYSQMPVWSTGTTLADVSKNAYFTRPVVATEGSGATLTYSLSGGSLPGNVSLYSNGLVSGNIVDDIYSTNVYSFTINVVDPEFQNVPRTFGLTAIGLFSATGGTITTSGGYKIHTFTSSGTFVVTGTKSMDILVVAGGGSGGSNYNGFAGGGGGGGVVYNTNTTLTSQSYTITVGGAASNSVFGALYTALAGGRGGDDSPYTSSGTSGASGGSGGGGGIFENSGNFVAGSGGAGTSGQGFSGAGAYGSGGIGAGGGGGGAGGAGLGGYVSGSYTVGGNGGPGILNSITGTGVYYAGGGGGDASNGRGSGGVGGGGAGRTSGTANTGGGGGAAASGGSGIVIVRYLM